MKTKYIFPVAILIFMVGGFTYFFSVQASYDQNSINKPFVITYSRYRQSNPNKKFTIVKLVSSQGTSLSKLIGQDGRDLEHMAIQYDQDDWKKWSNREDYLQSTKVVRTEQIHGITAYIYRQEIGENGVIETWYAPETGPIPIKEILEKKNGDAVITEAINIEFREVSGVELMPDANLLVDFTR
jgi:hypothetical protein